ncbi:MAG TPA: ATP-binding protein [Streptosporangiales bacterium]
MTLDQAAPTPTGGEPVGRVLGNADATPLTFWTAVRQDGYLQLDDVVVTERELAGREPVTIAGVVTQVRARHEGAQFDSDVFLVSDGMLPAEVQEAAEVSVTRVEPEVYVPPRPGAVVRRAVEEQRSRALYFDKMDRKVALGVGRDGEPVYLDLDFLDGTRGGHVSISGVSGVATKTSFATWLLYSVFRGGALTDAHNARALIFSVKGEDLLLLDHPNTRIDEAERARYAALGLPAEPFGSVAVLAPPLRGDSTGRPDVSVRDTGVDAFFWTLADFCADALLPYAFADVEDERQQYTMVVHQVAARLQREAKATADGAVHIDGELLRTYADLVDFLQSRLLDDATQRDWAGPATTMGTVNAFLRRLMSSRRALDRLVRSDITTKRPHDITGSDAQVTVVDLHSLPDAAQRFVVGVTLQRLFDAKEGATSGRSLQFVVLDELNKYAPREGSSPIKEVLLDIAERGRSLGVILVGAQQTASEVERRIVANSSVRVVGRLDSAESARPEYAFLPPAQRARAVLAKPGTMFVAQPEIPVPLVVEFPFPAWATRPAEAGPPPATARRSATQGVDPFTMITDTDDDIPF